MRCVPVWLLIVVLPVLARAQNPGVFVGAATGPSVRMFDPANPPIPIKPPEVAITRFEPGARGGHPQFSFDGTTLTIVRLDSPSVSANIMIFLPYGVTPNITEHENGHSRLCQYEYAKAAQRLANAAWTGFLGMRFVGRGATPAQRQMDAIQQVDAEGLRRTKQAAFSIGVEVAKLNDIYDNLTQHGNNPAIDTAKGEAMAKQQFEAGVRTNVTTAPLPRPAGRSNRSRRNKLLALTALLCGGALLVYGVWSFARS